MATKRNFEDIWLEVFPFCTQLDMLDTVHQYKWNFSNLEEALEEGGELHNKKVYLFGLTKHAFVPYKGQSKKFTLVPVVVAVVLPFPPSDKICIARKRTVEIVPMEQMNMRWDPYIPLENRESQVERLKDSQIFILSCNERRAGQTNLEIDHLKQLENCMPYFYNPLPEDDLKKSTVVELVLRSVPNRVIAEFDLKRNNIEELTNRLIELKELPADEKETFMKCARDKIHEAEKSILEARESIKKAWDDLDQKSKAEFEKMEMHPGSSFKFLEPANIERFTNQLIEEEKLPEAQKVPLLARESRKKAQDNLDPQLKAAFKNMKLYKFYPVPTPDTPDVSGVKSSVINRYYGKAHEVI